MSDEKWDDLTAEVEEASGNRAPGCTFGAWIKTLDKLGRIQVEAVLGRKELTTTAIARSLRKRGAGVSDFTIRRHRRGDCSCEQNG